MLEWQVCTAASNDSRSEPRTSCMLGILPTELHPLIPFMFLTLKTCCHCVSIVKTYDLGLSFLFLYPAKRDPLATLPGFKWSQGVGDIAQLIPCLSSMLESRGLIWSTTYTELMYNISLFMTEFFTVYYLFIYLGEGWQNCGGQRIICRSWFFPSTIRVPEMDFRFSGLAAGAIACWVISLAWERFFFSF